MNDNYATSEKTIDTDETSCFLVNLIILFNALTQKTYIQIPTHRNHQRAHTHTHTHKHTNTHTHTHTHALMHTRKQHKTSPANH